jgi:hypothetical protein
MHVRLSLKILQDQGKCEVKALASAYHWARDCCPYQSPCVWMNGVKAIQLDATSYRCCLWAVHGIGDRGHHHTTICC